MNDRNDHFNFGVRVATEQFPAVLDQLTPDILKTSDGEALRKFHAVVQRWADLAAAELVRRDEER